MISVLYKERETAVNLLFLQLKIQRVEDKTQRFKDDEVYRFGWLVTDDYHDCYMSFLQ